MDHIDEDINILCVDDEPNVLSALKRLFLDDDFTIHTAASGPDGIALLEREHVQLIISDYRMPVMTGVEFLTEVYKRWPETVRIVLSGYADSAAIVGAINEGHIYKFVPKPWNDAELKVTVSNSLERYFLFKKNRELTAELTKRNEELQSLNRQLSKLIEEQALNLTFREMMLKSHQNILDAIPVGIIGFDQEGLIATCNSTCLKIINRKYDILGENICDMGVARFEELYREVFAEGSGVAEISIGAEEYRLISSRLDQSTGQQGAIITIIPCCDKK